MSAEVPGPVVGSADWCSSQAPTYELRRVIVVPLRAQSVGISRTYFFTAFDSAFAPKIACRSPLSLISVLDDEKSVPRGATTSLEPSVAFPSTGLNA